MLIAIAQSHSSSKRGSLRNILCPEQSSPEAQCGEEEDGGERVKPS